MKEKGTFKKITERAAKESALLEEIAQKELELEKLKYDAGIVEDEEEDHDPERNIEHGLREAKTWKNIITAAKEVLIEGSNSQKFSLTFYGDVDLEEQCRDFISDFNHVIYLLSDEE